MNKYCKGFFDRFAEDFKITLLNPNEPDFRQPTSSKKYQIFSRNS